MKLIKNTYATLLAPKEYRHGLCHFKQKQWQQAQEAFLAGYKKSPQHAQNTFKLGLCYLKLDMPAEAYDYISQAITLAPYNTQWQKQLTQCEKKLNSTYYVKAQDNALPVKRIRQANTNQSIDIEYKKKVLLVPSDYNHRVMADISSFIEYYKNDFDVYIILRELAADIVRKGSHTLVKNGTPYAEFLKFTSEYVIDAGTMNFGYKISEKNQWVSVWHGIPYKKMFVDVSEKNLATAIRYNMAYDSMISMSDFYTDTFLRNSLRYDGTIHQIGCAKMDHLFKPFSDNSQNQASRLKVRLRLPENKRVLLYMPAYREHSVTELPFSAQKLLSELGKDYMLLAVTPYPVQAASLSNSVFHLYDLSDLEALLLADVLLTDYHPLMYQFDQHNRPVVLFQYDQDEFSQKNRERSDELALLARRKYVAVQPDTLYCLDWQRIQTKAARYRLPADFEGLHIRHSLGIPRDKKIILYAPTFRKAGKVQLPFDPDKLLAGLNNEYVLITKMHYLNYLEQDYAGVIDCTSYSNMSDLMHLSDILISDYSSLVLDYAVLNKPIILFQYDYQDYMNNRGVYFDFSDYLPESQILQTEQQLYDLNWQQLERNNHKLIETFYPLEKGDSTQKIVDTLQFDASIKRSKDLIFLVNELNQIGGVHSFLKNFARYYKEKYNSRIFVIAIKEFAESNAEYHVLESPYIDFKLSSQYLNGACANILKNTDGIVISLQFSAHLHFQKYLDNAKSILMFHGDVKDMINRTLYKSHIDWLNSGKLYNYEKLVLLTQSAVDLLKPHLNDEIGQKLDYVHNSIDIAYQPIATDKVSGSLNAAVISRLDPDKNIYVLLDLGEAIKQSQANITINIYGDGSLRHDFENQIKQRGLENILKLQGFESKKQRIFTNNSSLLLMSKSEGFPLVVLEAYAHGKPVVVFDSFTAAKDIVRHGETGYLLPYGDYAAVIESIQNVNNLESCSIEQMFRQFSNETVFAKWNTVFSQLDEKI